MKTITLITTLAALTLCSCTDTKTEARLKQLEEDHKLLRAEIRLMQDDLSMVDDINSTQQSTISNLLRTVSTNHRRLMVVEDDVSVLRSKTTSR